MKKIDYSKKKTTDLIRMCVAKFNEFIRLRDKDEPCINCKEYRILQAGHFFPAGTYKALKFDEDNVHGECKQCNFFNSQSHAYKYRPNLIEKIGQERFDKLELKAQITKGKPYKFDRFTLIQIYEIYTEKVKQLKN